jgi:hypothetical protein
MITNLKQQKIVMSLLHLKGKRRAPLGFWLRLTFYLELTKANNIKMR